MDLNVLIFAKSQAPVVEIKTCLGFSVHQDIDIKLFLKLDNFVNFLLNRVDVIFLRHPTERKHYQNTGHEMDKTWRNACNIVRNPLLFRLVFTSNSSEFHGLRERANSSGRQNWEV